MSLINLLYVVSSLAKHLYTFVLLLIIVYLNTYSKFMSIGIESEAGTNESPVFPIFNGKVLLNIYNRVVIFRRCT